MGNGLSGLPFTQTLVYAFHKNKPHKVDPNIMKHLISSDDLDVNVIRTLIKTEDPQHPWYTEWCSPVELAINLRRIDIAKLMVIAGANPIHPSLSNVSGVVQLLNEYYEFGTNQYLRWLLNQHTSLNELPQLITNILKLDIFNESAKRISARVGRHLAHAFLICGHEKMTRKFIEHRGVDMLNSKDATGKTALQIAAQMGDVESVSIILKLYVMHTYLTNAYSVSFSS